MPARTYAERGRTVDPDPRHGAAPPRPQPRSIALLERGDGATAARMFIALQQGCGNAAVGTLVGQARAGLAHKPGPGKTKEADEPAPVAEEVELASAAECPATPLITVLPDGIPLTPLDDDLYGRVQPVSVGVRVAPCRRGSTWIAGVAEVIGHYSKEARLLKDQVEITGPGGNTTAETFETQVLALWSLGRFPGNRWYMKAAIEAHEAAHEEHARPALAAIAPAVVEAFAAVSIPDDGRMSPEDALAALSARLRANKATTGLTQAWYNEMVKYVESDHALDGAADKAEHTVVDPMKNRICEEATAQGWPSTPYCELK